MRLRIKIIFFFIFAIFVSLNKASAHQPRIVESRVIEVNDPEISKAYYGKLKGESDVYFIKEDKPFNLYVNILVPDLPDQKRDVSLIIVKDKNFDNPIAVFSYNDTDWKQIYESFGGDFYLTGKEYRKEVEAGEYQVHVLSSENDSKYTLAIGETEYFNFEEIVNALNIVPKLKKDFFDKSPINFIASPFGWGFILISYVFAVIITFIFYFIFRKIINRFLEKTTRRAMVLIYLVGLLAGVILLSKAILTTWNFAPIFISGLFIAFSLGVIYLDFKKKRYH